MSNIKIALVGNPNSGKTTLFNALTGSNQFVGNWPGVTVEKKEGKLKKHDGVTVADLPGIYSLSPYSPEEVVARNYLINECPDVILNIVDGTNLERNLYLTTQLSEIGIPVVVVINMMDIVRKNGDKINIEELSRCLGCKVIEISALKNEGIMEAVEIAIHAAKNGKTIPQHLFSGAVEHAIAHIEEAALHDLPEEQQRWYAIKIFERDEKVLKQLNIEKSTLKHIESDIQKTEKEMDDDAESIITNERYIYIASIVKSCCKKKNAGKLTRSDKIDRIVTNRWLGLPVFAIVMFLVYFLAMGPMAPGTLLTNWANDGVFGESGWHLFGVGSLAYTQKSEEYTNATNVIDAFLGLDDNSTVETVKADFAKIPTSSIKQYEIVDEETLKVQTVTYTYAELQDAVSVYEGCNGQEPNPDDYGVYVRSIPVLVEKGLDELNVANWLKGLIINGILAGVGAVLGFVPQIVFLFLLLAFLEGCGYMARIAFVLDRLFRKFGLSGKSFIPLLVGVGCSVPGIMASRTIENQRDRRMTIITTTFIPCSAKVPFIGMIAGAFFGGSALVSVSAYFIGIASIIVSGIILKKLKMFSGDPAPFVMELPAYHMPTVSNVMRSTWDRGWSFVKKAGTVILLSSVVVWFASYFGFVDGTFRLLADDELDSSLLATVGSVISWIFKPLGFGTWQATVASITGLLAKENIVGTINVLYSGVGQTANAALSTVFTSVTGFAFLVFNLLCAPCVAAMGAIRREMNSAKWTFFAIGYQCIFAYAISLMINQFGGIFIGDVNVIGIICAAIVLFAMVYMVFIKKSKEPSLN